jgi:hypothetical protein
MRKIKNQIFLLAISIMIVSCTKEITTQTYIQTGSIVGYVTLYDENGNLISDKSGVNISISGWPSFDATTNGSGRFELDNVPTGTYNISFTKDGFSETKRVGYEFVGGENPVIITQVLAKPTSVIVKSISLIGDSITNEVHANIQLSYLYNGSTGYVRLFFGLSDKVTNLNYDYTNLVTFLFGVESATALLNPNYTSGTKVYIIAYGAPNYYSSYIDINTGTTIYPSLNLNAPQIASIIIH